MKKNVSIKEVPESMVSGRLGCRKRMHVADPKKKLGLRLGCCCCS